MNCVLGDLAYVHARSELNMGKVVTCLRLASTEEIAAQGPALALTGPTWVTDRPLLVMNDKTLARREVYLAPDHMLRPIRDPGDDAVDETLTGIWLPATEQVPA